MLESCWMAIPQAKLTLLSKDGRPYASPYTTVEAGITRRSVHLIKDVSQKSWYRD